MISNIFSLHTWCTSSRRVSSPRPNWKRNRQICCETSTTTTTLPLLLRRREVRIRCRRLTKHGIRMVTSQRRVHLWRRGGVRCDVVFAGRAGLVLAQEWRRIFDEMWRPKTVSNCYSAILSRFIPGTYWNRFMTNKLLHRCIRWIKTLEIDSRKRLVWLVSLLYRDES